MKWYENLTITEDGLYRYKNLDFFIIESGNFHFATILRKLILKNNYSAIALDIEEYLYDNLLNGVKELPKTQIIFFNKNYILLEPTNPYIEAIRTAIEKKINIYFYRYAFFDYKQVKIFEKPAKIIDKIGNALYHNIFFTKEYPEVEDSFIPWYNAGYLNYIRHDEKHILVLINPIEFQTMLKALLHGGEYVKNYKNTKIQFFQIDNLFHSFITNEFPYFTYLYEKLRNNENNIDIFSLLIKNFRKYIINNKKKIINKHIDLSSYKLKQTLNYAFKLAYWDGTTEPDLYNLLKSFKMFYDDEIGIAFLNFSISNPLNPFQIKKNKKYLDLLNEILENKRINYFPYSEKIYKIIKFKSPPPAPKIEKWKAQWNKTNNIVSWPPEDIKIENFRKYIFINSLRMSNIAIKKVEEFKGSLKDGIDFRETLRKFYTGKIFVKEEPNINGKVGAKILIFDEDFDKYPYRSTWYAEHSYESTLCFYSTDPEKNIVGPGIGKSYYGGLLMIYPPIYFPNIWDDYFFSKLRNPIEILLIASFIYSKEKYVVFISKHHPEQHYYRWANKYKKVLVFIPISDFSSTTIEKIKTFHILKNKNLRNIAGNFIKN